jgi:hypothetical protein
VPAAAAAAATPPVSVSVSVAELNMTEDDSLGKITFEFGEYAV